MKVAVCTFCGDVFAARQDWATNRAWRWCQCGSAATRWTNGDTGQLQVTSDHGHNGVRVIGLANTYLVSGVSHPPEDNRGWRELHTEITATVEGGHLFHRNHRDCWAVIVRPGESSDVVFIDPTQVERPASSTDGTAQS